MTVKELKKFIEHLPDDMDVMIEQSNDESLYSMAQSAATREVDFQDEDIPEDEWPTIECLVISDDFLGRELNTEGLIDILGLMKE